MFNWVKKAKRLFSSSVSDNALVHVEDDGFMSENISVNIEDVIADESREDDLGKLHVLSLTEFHHALGDAWKAREDKIFMLTEGVLRDMMGPGNLWEKKSKEVYILLFPTLSEIEGEVRAFEIGEQVGFKIIGERFEGGKRPHARVGGVDPKDALNEDGSFNIEKLEEVGRLGKSMGGDEKEEHEDEDQDIGDNSPLDWKKKRHDSEEADTDWNKNDHEGQEADTDWHKKAHDSDEANTNWKKRSHKQGEEDLKDWEKLEREKKEEEDPQWVQISKDDVQKATAPKPKKPASRFALTYGPCWDRHSESLHIYRAILTYNHPNGKSYAGATAYKTAKDAGQRFKIDTWVLNNTAKMLTLSQQKKVEAPIIIAFAATSLRGDYAQTMIDQIGKIAHTIRRNLFIIEILDDGKWTDNELDQVLRPFSQLVHGVAFRLSHENNFTAPTDCTQIKWIGVDLSAMSADTGIESDTLQTLITTHENSYVFGLNQRAQMQDMVAMGVKLISGPALVKNTKVLRPPFKLPIQRLQS